MSLNKPLRDYQIEKMLLQEENFREREADLIEYYFRKESSLDLVSKRALELLRETQDEYTLELIRKNLLECILVKNQIEKTSVLGWLKKFLTKLGLNLGKSGEIRRAEKVIEVIQQRREKS